uniref:Orphan peptide AbOp-15 n=1 Tax=Androctonus bicolor TaxID=748906 RepID=A0A0K0LC20_9SCOR|nr:orphan peptide AbOp-15 [Androctonus bicolor]
MKNLAIIMLCLISLSTSLSLPSVPLYPSSVLSAAKKDPIKELSKAYCSLKNTGQALNCIAENHQKKSIDQYGICVQKVKSLKTSGQISDFYCNKMNRKEYAKVKACMDPEFRNWAATDPTFLPTLLNCMFKEKKSEG